MGALHGRDSDTYIHTSFGELTPTREPVEETPRSTEDTARTVFSLSESESSSRWQAHESRRSIVNAYFEEFPDVIVRGEEWMRERLQSGELSVEAFQRMYAKLAQEYVRLEELTKELFPNDISLQAMSLAAVTIATSRKLEAMQENWIHAVERLESEVGGNIVGRLVGRALVLTEGIRNCQKAAEYEGVDLRTHEQQEIIENTSERLAAK